MFQNILTFSICVTLAGVQVLATGVFEIRVDEFVNQAGRAKNGECCELSLIGDMEICSKPCRTSFHVCFTHFQLNPGSETECTFGSAKTPVLGSNSIPPTQSESVGPNIIGLKFNFTWPEFFGLVIEATHEQESNKNLPGKLIARMQKTGQIHPNQDWATETQTQQEKILRYSYRVKCDQHYYGDGCSKYCRPRDDMFGHYTCDRKGEKVCLEGWESGEGKYCLKPICLPGCSATHGDCKRPNECICRQGWIGKLCDECQTYPECKHGTCQKPFECNCEPGWGGMLCNLDLNYCTNHKPCKNGARCTNSGQGSYSCECQPGFTGRNCENEMNECEPNPCKNEAKCTVQKFGGYTCECPENFFGSNCEKTHVTCATTPCKNGGTCVEEPTQYRCRCKHGFRGINCEIEEARCSPKTCLNGGICQNSKNGFMCSCSKGYSGKRCQNQPQRCQSNTCKNSGACVNNIDGFECVCSEDFFGKRCERKRSICSYNPCQNGGKCFKLDDSSLTCICGSNYKGEMCETPIADGLSAGQYEDKRNTQIIVLTKDEKSGLNTAQWVAVCFGSGFLLLIFVAIAICVVYQRQMRTTYIGGRPVSSNFSQSATSEAGNQNLESASDRSSVGLYSATSPAKSNYLSNDLSHERELYSSEIVVVPTNSLSPARKYHMGSKSSEFLSKLPENNTNGRRDKRSSLILTAGQPAHNHKQHPGHGNSHYDIGCVKPGDDVSESTRCSTHSGEVSSHMPHRHMSSRPLNRQRHGEGLRLPTYQEACREERTPTGRVV